MPLFLNIAEREAGFGTTVCRDSWFADLAVEPVNKERMKRNKIIYLISTGLMTFLMLMSAGMYFFKYDMVAGTFQDLGFPTFIIYPLAIAKILGLLAIWTKKSNVLKEWAYAGFFFDFVLAFGAHVAAKDGSYATALVAIVLVLVSYIFEKRSASAIGS